LFHDPLLILKTNMFSYMQTRDRPAKHQCEKGG
jgi:hypothetical protein